MKTKNLTLGQLFHRFLFTECTEASTASGKYYIQGTRLFVVKAATDNVDAHPFILGGRNTYNLAPYAVYWYADGRREAPNKVLTDGTTKLLAYCKRHKVKLS